MGIIFPGMDPWLEAPHFWPGFQTCFVVYLTETLQNALSSRYSIDIRECIYQESNDLEIREAYAVILDRRAARQLITVIYLMSPGIKTIETARIAYLDLRDEWFARPVNLVEIDLLRAGSTARVVPEESVASLGPGSSSVVVRRTNCPERYEVYPVQLRKQLPRIRVPLAKDDPDLVLDLAGVLARVIEARQYEDSINYDRACVPALSTEDQAWANERIQAARQQQ
jgi:hypothetical protein